jgi:elongation factor Ts
MEITAQLVNELRQKTGAGMMDCKRALKEVGGDLDKATTWLREKGMLSAGKKSTRVAAEGTVESYIHAGGKLGVLVEINSETDFVARGADFRTFCHEVAMHIAAANPDFVSPDEIPAERIEEEKKIYRAQAKESGKPEQFWDKIVEGRVKKYYAEVCLLEQPWVRDQAKSIEQLRQELVAKTGENVKIRRFVRFVLGEGIEKKKNDLAAEVAAQLKGA